jgi:hypothetical protein
MAMTRTLSLTSPFQHGADVKTAQTKLISGGWLRKGGNDGTFGPESARAAGQAHWWLGFSDKLAKAETYGATLDKVLTEWLKTKTLPDEYAKRRATRMKAVTLGSKALEWLRAHVGDTESPPQSNRVPWASEWYGVIGPWCAMGATRAYIEVGSTAFARGQRWAYVPYIVNSATAGRDGLVRTFDPKPGDLWCVDWEGNGSFDHVELVDKPPRSVSSGAAFTTVGCNTSFDDKGDQSNGGAVAAKSRTVLGGGRSVFVRVTR